MHNRILVIFIILAVAPFAWPVPSSAQVEVIPGNSLRGAALFREKGCVECHAFRGAGARVGPDLAQPNERTHTPMQLATALWNHGPRMWREQENRRLGATLNSAEAADLFAYFYSLSYFTAPGDAARGSRVFEEKACATCHEKTGEVLHPSARSLSSPPSGPPDSSCARVEDPLWWAQRKIDLLKRPGPDLLTGYVAAMWNHAPLMHSRAGSEFPSGPWRSGSFNRSGWPRSGDSLLKSLMKSGIRSVPFPLMSSCLKMNGKTPTILAVKDDTWSTIFNT